MHTAALVDRKTVVLNEEEKKKQLQMVTCSVILFM